MQSPLGALFWAEAARDASGGGQTTAVDATACPPHAVATNGLRMPPADFDSLLDRLCTRGRDAFPQLAVRNEDFVSLLARSLTRAGLAVDQLSQLAIEDLYLACACMTGIPGAAAAFDDRCRAPVRAAIGTIAGSAAARDEVEQQLRDVLLVGTGEAPAKIASYSGQGALGKWVAVVAQRLALMMARADKTEARARDAAASEALSARVDPELAFVKEQYRGAFRLALEQSLAALPERERLVMRLHLVSGMTVDKIAKVYSVSQSTVSRWLANARTNVLAGAQQRLSTQLGISADEMESLAGLMASQLDLSMSRVLRHP